MRDIHTFVGIQELKPRIVSKRNYLIFNLTHSIIVSVQNCKVLEFGKRLFKDLTKFHDKNITTMSAGCFFENGTSKHLFSSKCTPKTWLWFFDPVG